MEVGFGSTFSFVGYNLFLLFSKKIQEQKWHIASFCFHDNFPRTCFKADMKQNQQFTSYVCVCLLSDLSTSRPYSKSSPSSPAVGS